MTDTDRLNDIFANLWNGEQGKHLVTWCGLCNTAIISCLEPDCHGSTCNAGGCDKCKKDFDEFNTYKTTVFEYLTDEEKSVYEKALRIQHFIMETIPTGMKELDWKKLDSEGKLSDYDRWMFLSEIYGKKPIGKRP